MSDSGKERRKAFRRPVLETFSLFAVVPKKGPHRLQIHDLSDTGMGFDVDTEGEVPEDFPIKIGESLDVHFYVNQSLYLPLTVTVSRLTTPGSIRRIGAEFKEKSSKSYKAFKAFAEMLDAISEVGKIES